MRTLRSIILPTIISATLYQNTFSQQATELQKLVAHDRASTDFFGYSVSIDGDYAIIGAYNEDEDVSGNNTVVNTGSVYIIERSSDGTWQQKTKLVASDRNPGDFFGKSVSISGNYAIVGTQQDVEDDSGDNTLSVAGSAYIFERDSEGIWTETAKLMASDRASSDFFGDAVSIYGEYAVVGARAEDQDANGGNFIDNAGSAYVFKRANDGTWNELTKLVASDRASYDSFGASVAIEGNYIIVGANQEDEDENGENTAVEAGAAYIFERAADDSWTEVAKLVASDRAQDDVFGFPVAISENKAVIGAHLEDEDSNGDNRISKAGAAYVFERSDEGNWFESAKLVASDRSFGSYFGISVDISGHYIVVGAANHEDVSVGVAGAAYVFRRTATGEWIQDTQLLASDRNDDDEFGYAVAIDGGDVFIGANREDEDENNDNTASAAGSVYVYDLPLTKESVTQCDTYIFDNTTLTSSGTYSATFLDDSGLDSLVTLELAILETMSEESVSVCGSFEFGTQLLTESGTYTEVFKNKSDCDSTVTLAFENLETLTSKVVLDDMSLSINEIDGANYQWYNCDTEMAIDDAMQHIFSPSESGSYYVEVRNNGCSSKSSCTLFNLVTSVGDYADTEIYAFPNPTNQKVCITIPNTNTVTATVHVVDIIGRTHNVKSDINDESMSIELPNADGIYIIKILTSEGLTYSTRVTKRQQ